MDLSAMYRERARLARALDEAIYEAEESDEDPGDPGPLWERVLALTDERSALRAQIATVEGALR